MKLMKSILLGSAAGIVAAASAQAADLPTKKAAPAEYVKICDAYGVGFFYIPGTDTCLRIGGFARAEYSWMNSRNTLTPGGAVVSARAIDQTGFRARGRLQFDARNQTAWGTLRAFGRFDFTSDAGIYKNGNAIGTGNTNNYVSVRYIFIQWAGITAGQAQSFFDFYADAINWERLRGSDTYMPLLAYTATFGGGFSATLSVEDRSKRMANTNAALNGGVTYAGYRSPDIVGNLRVDQAWGSAQLSGALHQVNTVAGSAVGAPSADKWGWAVQGGLMFNLPQLAAGDQLWLQASYAKGALDYVGIGTANQGNVSGGYLGRFHGGLLRNDTDAWAYACGVGGYCLDLSSAWSVTAGLRHFWAPTFRQDIYGSYLNVKPGSSQRLTDWTVGGLGKATEWTVGTTLTWIPVSGFEIGLDLVYAKLKQDLAGGAGGIAPTLLPVTVKRDPDTYQARLRFQRAF